MLHRKIRRKLNTHLKDDGLSLLRELMIETLRIIARDPRQHQLLQILYHTCEFNGEMYSEKEIRERLWFNRERFRKLLQNCISKGQVPVNTNIELLTTIVHGYFSGIVKNWLMQPENLDLYEQAPELVDNILLLARKSI